ncbi:hypothetical protein FRC01_002572, partial [Tulasnella sp. 417]
MSSHLPWSRNRGQPIPDPEAPPLTIPPPPTPPLLKTYSHPLESSNTPGPQLHRRSVWTRFWRNLFEDVDLDYWDGQAIQADDDDTPKTEEEVKDVLKAKDDGDNEEIDVIVVERDVDLLVPATGKSTSLDSNPGNNFSVSLLGRATPRPSEDLNIGEPPNSNLPASRLCMIKFGRTLCRIVVKRLKRFFSPTFPDEATEERFTRERFNQMKFLAVAGSCLVFINWLFIVCLVPARKMILPDKIFYWGIAPWLVIPIPVLIYCNWPRKYPSVYQLFTSFALWAWSAYSLLLIQLCGYYDPTDKIIDCKSMDFLNLFFYTSAFPAIGLFGLGQTRSMTAITALLNVALMGSIIRYRMSWSAHYVWERDSRRVYRMRDELKAQVRQAQQARDREIRLEKSKRSLTSYIFHELRVPLNIANLARGNLMKEVGIHPDFSVEAEALGHSLEAMTQVLNDILDFNRMESGKFKCVSHPYPFHRTLGVTLQGLALGAREKGINLQTEFDHGIDFLANQEMALAMAETSVSGGMEAGDDGNDYSHGEMGIVVGDANRLRQIMNNLVSNAIKFTDRGGTITVRTKSLGFCWPIVTDSADDAPPITPTTSNGNANFLSEKAPSTSNTVSETDEVEDNGAGIQKKWVTDNKLFSAY